MPNHITNILDIRGAQKTIAALLKKIYSVGKATDPGYKINVGDEIYTIDFNGTVPMPKELEGTTSPAHTSEEKKLQAGYARKYGAGNWYDWCIKFWGTKWGGYDACKAEELPFTVSNGTRLRFNTAWGPPSEWLAATSKLYPSLEFTDCFHDEGGGAGRFTMKNGEITKEENVSDHDWFMEFDQQYKEQYEFLTKGNYQKVIETYSAPQVEMFHYDLQVALLNRIKDEDLPLFIKFEWWGDAKADFDSRLKGNEPKPSRKIRWKDKE